MDDITCDFFRCTDSGIHVSRLIFSARRQRERGASKAVPQPFSSEGQCVPRWQGSCQLVWVVKLTGELKRCINFTVYKCGQIYAPLKFNMYRLWKREHFKMSNYALFQSSCSRIFRTLTVPCSGNFRGSNQIVIGSQAKSWNDILCCQGLFNGGYLACFGKWEWSSSSECIWRLLGLHLQSHITNCHWMKAWIRAII